MNIFEKIFFKIKKSTDQNIANNDVTYTKEQVLTNKTEDEKKYTKNLTINIGIDFGTSYSKVCFAERKEFNFVKFPEGQYKNSILFFDHKEKILYYSRPQNNPNIEEIRYFKYSMIDESLPKSKHLIRQNIENPEKLFCTFFLACLINESKNYANKHYNERLGGLLGKINFEWAITLGVPVDNYSNEHHKLYDKILHIAYKLSKTLNNISISISSLNEFYRSNQDIEIPKFKMSPINTLPELYAESLIFLQSRNTQNGIYALVDIGGGTVDMAIIYKEDAEKKIFSIVSKRIDPLGVEIVSHKITSSSESINEVKLYLEKKTRFDSLHFINYEKEKKLKKDFKEAFATIVLELKKKDIKSYYNNKHALYTDDGKLKLYCIICGGGTKYEWYKDGILQKISDFKQNMDLKFEIIDVEKLLPEKTINHRLLISYVLSQRIEDIPELKGYPWDFGDTKYSIRDVEEERHNVMKNKYGG